MPVPAPPARPPRRRSSTVAWLQQLRLLAELPYRPAVLLPAVLATLRRGVRADFGNAIELEPRTLAPLHMVTERFSSATTRYAQQSPQDFFELLPIDLQVASQGEALRRYALSAEYERCRPYLHYYAPLGVRWSTGVPLRDAEGHAQALLFLHRRREWGPFTDVEQALLRRAARALLALTLPRPREPVRTAPAQSLRARATLVLGPDGRFLGSSAQARRMLFDSQLPEPGDTRWAGTDLRALPPAVADAAAALLRGDAERLAPLHCTLGGLAGEFGYLVEPLRAPPADGADADSSDGPAMVAVHIHDLEPTELALARRLICLPLSLQQKRVLLASLACPEQQALAERLGISLNTLKSHVSQILRHTGASSRQALVSQILQSGDDPAASDWPPSEAPASSRAQPCSGDEGRGAVSA